MNGFLKPLFGAGGTVSKPLIAVFLLVNLITAYNTANHNPAIGYDAVEHIKYIDTLSRGRLPALEENYEFFSPPLPYVLPAVLKSTGILELFGATRFFLFLNFLYGLATTFLLLAICRLVQPDSIAMRVGSLLMLAVLPVYYRSFSMVRAEPLFVMLTLAVIWLTIRIALLTGTQERRKEIVLSIIWGIIAGAAMLTRQWTVFVIIALIAFWTLTALKNRPVALHVVKSGLISIIAAFLVSSWFYFHLKKDYGSFTPFNRTGAESFSFSNQPRSFYTGNGDGKLFSEPVRPSFANQLLPIIHSDTWGDYWCYFQVRGVDTRKQCHVAGSMLVPPIPELVQTNRNSIISALARNNVVGILPASLMIAGFLYGIFLAGKFVVKKINVSSALPEALSFISVAIIVIGFLGYLWFLIMYPHPAEGDTIKATYILQLYPLACLLTGLLVSRIEEKNRKVYLALCAVLAIILIHNLPTCLTRYVL